MSDPSLALQRAIYQTLAGDAAVAAQVANRIFDQVPTAAAPVFPYIVIGETQVLDDTAGCIDGSVCNLDLHVWSRARGSVETKAIVASVRDALDDADMDLSPDHRLIEFAFESALVFRDEDGTSTHGVVSFRALTEAA